MRLEKWRGIRRTVRGLLEEVVPRQVGGLSEEVVPTRRSYSEDFWTTFGGHCPLVTIYSIRRSVYAIPPSEMGLGPRGLLPHNCRRVCAAGSGHDAIPLRELGRAPAGESAPSELVPCGGAIRATFGRLSEEVVHGGAIRRSFYAMQPREMGLGASCRATAGESARQGLGMMPYH